MDNYAKMQAAAARRFCTYDMELLARKNGVTDGGAWLGTRFLGQTVQISRETGAIWFPDLGRGAGFGEAMTLYDWLCDGKPGAVLSGEFCPVSSLPGVLVSGGGLKMTGPDLARRIDGDPEGFLARCRALDGRPVAAGDLGVEFTALPGLPVRLKFYRSDEEFPPSLTLLWDKNVLQFLRYETLYYLAGCLIGFLGVEK